MTAGAPAARRPVRRPVAAWVTVVVLATALAVVAARQPDPGVMAVGASAENFRDAPNGRRLGTLLQGTQVERISQEGKWVRFRVEGWMWGPSLEGFETDAADGEAAGPEPRLPLRDNLPRLKRFVEEKGSVFYSLELDDDLGRLTLRLRLRALAREALERRQMAMQVELLEVLGEALEFDSIRVASNRPDGSGAVGVEIAETGVDDIRRLAGADDPAAWRRVTRFSSDGGETWTP